MGVQVRRVAGKLVLSDGPLPIASLTAGEALALADRLYALAGTHDAADNDDEPMSAEEARDDREASRSDWEYQSRKEAA